MSRLFNRKAAFLYGKRGTSEFTRLEGLRITFDIKMTSIGTTPSEGKFSIYNLSMNTRSFLETEEDLIGILEVGYLNDTAEIFIGDLTKVSSARKGAEFVTTIEVGDGNEALTKSIINKSYNSGIDLKTVLKDVAQTFKDTAGVVIDSVNDVVSKVNQNGLSVSGASKEVLTNLLGKIDPNLEWSIQRNELQILETDVATGEDSIKLTPQTGLLSIPVKSTKDEKEGVLFKSLIMANELKPGRALEAESENISGIFKILEVQFVGDTHGNTWIANTLGKEIG